MNQFEDSPVKKIIDNLSLLIYQELRGVANEQYHPSLDPDRMDDQIAEGKKTAAELRKIRENFENTMTRIVLPF